MGFPSRQTFEFRLNLNVVGRARRPSMPDGIRYRIDKAIRRRAEMLGLRVYLLQMDAGRIRMDALLQPQMNRSNIERAMWGAINGILRREMPHMVKRTGQKGRAADIGGVFF
mgnify:CR=1 FL=1